LRLDTAFAISIALGHKEEKSERHGKVEFAKQHGGECDERARERGVVSGRSMYGGTNCDLCVENGKVGGCKWETNF
jgi:hypothetical protein